VLVYTHGDTSVWISGAVVVDSESAETDSLYRQVMSSGCHCALHANNLLDDIPILHPVYPSNDNHLTLRHTVQAVDPHGLNL
jgi:hypothetical protein